MSCTGSALLNDRQYDSAIADFNEAIRIKPNLAAAYYGRAQAFEAEGREGAGGWDIARAKASGYSP